MSSDQHRPAVIGIGSVKDSLVKIIRLAAWVVLEINAFANTLYVDLNSTTPAAPYATWETASTDIQTAVDAAATGDHVVVNDGIYNIVEQVNIAKKLTVRSRNGCNSTIIDADKKCRVFLMSSNKGAVELRGFTITGGCTKGKMSSASGGGINATGSNDIRIADCIIKNCVSLNHSGGLHAVINGRNGATFYVENCIFTDNFAQNNGGGLSCYAAYGAVEVSRCLIRKNTAQSGRGGGIMLGSNATISDSLIIMNRAVSAGGGGVGGGEPDNDKVINCTIYGNSAGWGGGINKTQVYNSIIVNNRADSAPDIGETGSTVCNSCSPNLYCGDNSGNIRDKPLFVNAAEGDFRLSWDSPCIDAGSNARTNSLVDRAGNPRIADGDRDGSITVDMGAYELEVLQLDIDIKPDSKNTSVNLEARGRLPVAILSTDSFEVSSVDVSTIRFAGAKPVLYTFRDVDDDGDADLVLEFERKNLKLDPDCTQVRLIGDSTDGVPFVAVSEIAVVKE